MELAFRPKGQKCKSNELHELNKLSLFIKYQVNLNSRIFWPTYCMKTARESSDLPSLPAASRATVPSSQKQKQANYTIWIEQHRSLKLAMGGRINLIMNCFTSLRDTSDTKRNEAGAILSMCDACMADKNCTQ